MSHGKLHILIVHNEYKIPGGEDSVVQNEINLLRSAGHHVITYIRSNKEIDSYSLIQKTMLPLRSVYSRKTYHDICRLIKTESIDLVHVHNTLSVISPSVYYAALSCHVPVLQTVHNYRLLCPGAMLLRNGSICTDCITKSLSESVKHKCYRNSRVQTLISSLILRYHRMRKIYYRISYLCLTDFNKKMLLQINHGKKEIIHPDSIYVKPNFTYDYGLPVPYSERAEYFVYASRMDSSKGIWVLLNAWKKYEECFYKQTDSSQCKELYLCGSGPEEASVQQFIRESNLTHVHFMGQLSHDRLITFIRNALAVCMPTQWYEGFPVTIAESYSCGTPVIGSDLGNVGDLVMEGYTGRKFPSSDVNALTEIFLQWDHMEPSPQTLSKNARCIYEQYYSESVNLEQLLSIYEKVIHL